MNERPLYLGIDPGLTGAVAYLWPTWQVVHDTPVVAAKRKDYLVSQMAALLAAEANPAPFAVLEAVGTRPGQSAQSGIMTGRGGALWEAILATLGIPYRIVQPQAWKRWYGLLGQDKDASRARAQALFPALVPELSRKCDHGRAEALLLAEYGRRVLFAGQGGDTEE